jgi:hypothetical protein
MSLLYYFWQTAIMTHKERLLEQHTRMKIRQNIGSPAIMTHKERLIGKFTIRKRGKLINPSGDIEAGGRERHKENWRLGLNGGCTRRRRTTVSTVSNIVSTVSNTVCDKNTVSIVSKTGSTVSYTVSNTVRDKNTVSTASKTVSTVSYTVSTVSNTVFIVSNTVRDKNTVSTVSNTV